MVAASVEHSLICPSRSRAPGGPETKLTSHQHQPCRADARVGRVALDGRRARRRPRGPALAPCPSSPVGPGCVACRLALAAYRQVQGVSTCSSALVPKESHAPPTPVPPKKKSRIDRRTFSMREHRRVRFKNSPVRWSTARRSGAEHCTVTRPCPERSVTRQERVWYSRQQYPFTVLAPKKLL